MAGHHCNVNVDKPKRSEMACTPNDCPLLPVISHPVSLRSTEGFAYIGNYMFFTPYTYSLAWLDASQSRLKESIVGTLQMEPLSTVDAIA